jgi:hypothetical protein
MPEEAERGEYLRVAGLWGCGWRLSPEGMLEHVGEGKTIQMGSCYLVKKTAPALGYCPI